MLGEIGGVDARKALKQNSGKSASTKAGAARRETMAEMPCHDRALEHDRLGALRSQRS